MCVSFRLVCGYANASDIARNLFVAFELDRVMSSTNPFSIWTMPRQRDVVQITKQQKGKYLLHYVA